MKIEIGALNGGTKLNSLVKFIENYDRVKENYINQLIHLSYEDGPLILNDCLVASSIR